MGVQLRKMMRARTVVVIGATSKIGRATVEELSAQYTNVSVVAAVETSKDPRARSLRELPGVYLSKCDFRSLDSLRRVVRKGDAVLLVPAHSDTGARFSKLVIDAVSAERVDRLVIISNIIAMSTVEPSSGHRSVLSYEAVEAHARSTSDRSVALRIPLTMETLFCCREEIMYANRFVGSFAPTTEVPCIAVKDVAIAACEILAEPTRAYAQSYTLMNAAVTCSPNRAVKMLSQALGQPVQYRALSDEQLARTLNERGVPDVAIHTMIEMRMLLEGRRTGAEGSASSESLSPTGPDELETKLPASRTTSSPHGFTSTDDFRTITRRELTSPRDWLQRNVKHFVRSPHTQMQLFVLGSGDALYVALERFIANQVTAPMSAPAPAAGEASLPSGRLGVSGVKMTFCTIKSPPGAREHSIQVAGGAAASISSLLRQLSQLDVVVLIPPLRLGPDECMRLVKSIVEAAKQARVWGIVLVSSIFTGHVWNQGANRMGEMEQLVEKSGVPFAIVRLPLFMEYFLALTPKHRSSNANADAAQHGVADIEEEKQAAEPPSWRSAPPPPSGSEALLRRRAVPSSWCLMDRNLGSSVQYLMAIEDAAKAITAVCFTFPLHQRCVRTLFTQQLTMAGIEHVLQKYAPEGTHISLATVDALEEMPSREFWRIAFWTRTHVKEFLDGSVELSGQQPIEASLDFKELVGVEPVSLEEWAHTNAGCYAHALGSTTSTSSP
ncbi:TPA: hypothetical protein N0F65_013008 [Lagenidium giganteum]|uniref:NmrA-like domain-containing protein n=1 Tax=Lagenidium giganteum TaxID=4803 RepID=A0AAV2YPY3_9STRA|nr:TPA: hypothetical protein N0F65_013008 [Lagenidium giganteum]